MLFVDIFSVSNFTDVYNLNYVFNGVKYSIIANPNSVQIFTRIFQFFIPTGLGFSDILLIATTNLPIAGLGICCNSLIADCLKMILYISIKFLIRQK